MNIVFSKSELKAKLTRDQLKAYRHRQKVSRRETLFQQAEQLIRTSGDRDMRVSRRAAEELINEHKASRTLRLHRISSAISGAAALLACWWLVVAVSTPARLQLGWLCAVLSPALWLFAIALTGLGLQYKQPTTDEHAPSYYRSYAYFQSPPLRAFVALLLVHFWFRTAVLLDGGALSALLHPPAPPEGAVLASPSALSLVVVVGAPSVFALAIVLPLLVALPTHSANERLGGFNEVKQFQFYLGIAAIYAVVFGTRTVLRWVLPMLF